MIAPFYEGNAVAKPLITWYIFSLVDYDYDDDPTYSTVNDIQRKVPQKTAAKMVKAEFDYTAQGAEELSFREGDIIKVIREEDNTWWCGEFRGRTGMFPRDFVSLAK